MKEGEIQVKCLTQHLALREHVTSSRNGNDSGESDKGPTLGAPTAGCTGDKHVLLIATPVTCDRHWK